MQQKYNNLHQLWMPWRVAQARWDRLSLWQPGIHAVMSRNYLNNVSHSYAGMATTNVVCSLWTCLLMTNNTNQTAINIIKYYINSIQFLFNRAIFMELLKVQPGPPKVGNCWSLFISLYPILTDESINLGSIYATYLWSF